MQGTFRDHDSTGLLSIVAVLNGTYTRQNRHTREAGIVVEIQGLQVGQAPDRRRNGACVHRKARGTLRVKHSPGL